MSVAFWSVRVNKGESKQVEIPEGYVLNLVNVSALDANSQPRLLASRSLMHACAFAGRRGRQPGQR